MKKTLALKFLFLFLVTLSSRAQQNARPQAVTMTVQIGGTTPSNLGGALASPNLITILAFSEGLSSSCTTQNTCPVATQQDISMTMYQTSDFILLRQALINHTKFNLELTAAFGNGDLSKIYIEDATVSSISNGGSGGEDRLTMNVSIYAPKWDHYFDTAGVGGISHFGWNFLTNSTFSKY